MGLRYVAYWGGARRRGLLPVLRDGLIFVEPAAAGGKLAVSLMLKMRFSYPKDPEQQQHLTLLDGILVEEGEIGKKVLRYLVFYALDEGENTDENAAVAAAQVCCEWCRKIQENGHLTQLSGQDL